MISCLISAFVFAAFVVCAAAKPKPVAAVPPTRDGRSRHVKPVRVRAAPADLHVDPPEPPVGAPPTP